MEDMNLLNNIRHSCAHLLAAAIIELYPGTKLTIGPAIENGFYYDFDFPAEQAPTEKDFAKIEQKMFELKKSWTSFSYREVIESEAREFYKDNPYKLELIDEIIKKQEKITFYKAGDFEDLCRGGHSENPKEDIGSLKLLSIAGAYWRGSEKNKMLTRIYGTCFKTKAELDAYLQLIEEAKKRDHKKLGQQLELFVFHETSPGMAYWLPKGFILYNELLNFSRQVHKNHGYLEITTPILNKKELYETSGHWMHYRDDMFLSPMSYIRDDSKELLEGTETFGIKPMNCPNAMTIFGMKTRSYHDLPMRLSETSMLHRFELSGTLNGLFRAREFRQDDAHVFITMEQLHKEFESIMSMIEELYSAFKLSYRLRFGTKPEKAMGEDSDWKIAEEALKKVLDTSGKEYVIAEGEGAFYGPKVDILMKDSLGREWQTGTIQLDFQQPKNFGLRYITSDGSEQTPAVLHRAIYGSFERFIGILTEHYKGAFPVWLSPIQAIILPISEKHTEAALKACKLLQSAGVRADVDISNNTLGAKIRQSTLQKVPYLCIIGDKEIEMALENKVFLSVRTREGEDLGAISVENFLSKVQKEIETKL